VRFDEFGESFLTDSSNRLQSLIGRWLQKEREVSIFTLFEKDERVHTIHKDSKS
jgi:hypothetical protein